MSARLGALRQVARVTPDLERGIAFFRDVLGLALIARFGPLAFFDLDGVRLLLEQGDEPGGASVLYFAVDDLPGVRRELEGRGVVFEDEPHVIFTDDAGTFGPAGEAEWMTFFRDPDGGLLALSARRR